MDKGRIVKIQWTEYPAMFENGSYSSKPQDFTYNVGQKIQRSNMVIKEITFDFIINNIFFYIKAQSTRVDANGFTESKVWKTIMNPHNLRITHDCGIISEA